MKKRTKLPEKLTINPDKGVWQYQEAKAKLSKVMDNVASKGMQVIIRNQDEVFVVLSQEKFDEYNQSADSLVQFFKKAPCPDVEIKIERQKDLPREIDL